MKKIFTLLFVASCAFAHAQNNTWLFGTSKDSCKIVADEIMKGFNGGYKYVGTFEAEGLSNDKYFQVEYKSDSLKDEHGNSIIYDMNFSIHNNRYYLETLSGSFRDMFTVWQKYVDPKADKKTVIEKAPANKTFPDLAQSKHYVDATLMRSDDIDGGWLIKIGSFKSYQ
jgi:hypothetical protein